MKINKTIENKHWRGYWGKGVLIHYCWGFKLVQLFWKLMWRTIIKLKLSLPYDPAILLLGICPKDLMSDCTHTFSAMFIGALLTIARK